MGAELAGREIVVILTVMEREFLPSQCPEQLLDPPSLLFNGNGILS
jgi:hypothetical protein